MTVAFPLHWPNGWPRTATRKASQFRTGLNSALTNVRSSLAAFARESGTEARNVVISSNVSLGVDEPNDPGIAVWFQWGEAQRCIAVDRYRTPAENLQAIYHVIEARRTEIRHAGVIMARAAMAGFTAALPAPGSKPWWEVLQVSPDAPAEIVEAAYRRLARDRHPDRGGSHSMMAELNQARDDAMKGRGNA